HAAERARRNVRRLNVWFTGSTGTLSDFPDRPCGVRGSEAAAARQRTRRRDREFPRRPARTRGQEADRGKEDSHHAGVKWLITGAAGMVGSDLQRVLTLRGEEVVALTKSDLDITDSRRVNAVIGDAQPS